MIIKQISIFLENETGKLKEITNCLADKNIDLRAINIAETSDYGVVRIITNNNALASLALKEAGFIFQETPVVVVGIKDEAGGLAKIVEVMASKNIDIEYMYSIFSQTSHLACMVFKVAKPDDLQELLKENGFREVENRDLGI